MNMSKGYKIFISQQNLNNLIDLIIFKIGLHDISSITGFLLLQIVIIISIKLIIIINRSIILNILFLNNLYSNK